MNKNLLIGRWGELFLGIILCNFGLLFGAWAILYSPTINSALFLWVAPGIVGFTSNILNGSLILLFSTILVFCFELFYLNITKKWIYILYYLIAAPIFISIVTLWCSSLLLTISR